MKTKVPLVLAHDYLVQMGGAERVVASMMRHHLDAPLFTSVRDNETAWPIFMEDRVATSGLQHMPGMPHDFKRYFPLYPTAFRSFGPVSCEVAWISCSTFSKCLKLTPESVGICYLHNPTRFLWQPEEYIQGEVQSALLKRLVNLASPMLKSIDRTTARKMDVMVANSENVRQRIRTFYQRDAVVINPPVEVKRFEVSHQSEDFHLIVSRLLRYKRIDRAVEAFSKSGRRLIIAGVGPDRERLEGMAGPSVQFVGRCSDEEVERLMSKCQGLIFPGEEDFGITPVEAQACGKPVIALGRGGALETVQEGVTGMFYYDDDAEALMEAVKRADLIQWNPELIRSCAEMFSEERFQWQTSRLIEEAQIEHLSRMRSRRTLVPMLEAHIKKAAA